jgi:hypothetical protein
MIEAVDGSVHGATVVAFAYAIPSLHSRCIVGDGNGPPHGWKASARAVSQITSTMSGCGMGTEYTHAVWPAQPSRIGRR